MVRTDWVTGQDRPSAAAERIYAAAADMVSRKGFDALTIEALAAHVHCSPATIYRYVGGKAAILEAVTVRLSMRVVDSVREAIKDLEGSERIATAMVVALGQIRAEPLGELMMGRVAPGHGGSWLTDSPHVRQLAKEIIGSDDPIASQWLLRVTLALWFWPANDSETELDLVRRFVGPSFVKAY